jgi:methyl-accepting chemotaxis protein
MEAVKYRRHIRVVDGRFQYRAIAVSLSVILGGLVVFAVIVAAIYLALRAAGGTPRPEALLQILPALLINDLAIMALMIVVGIFTTHRVAGPIYRIESDIDRVIAGEKGVRVRLRRHDSFPDLAVKVNQLIERIDGFRKG